MPSKTEDEILTRVKQLEQAVLKLVDIILKEPKGAAPNVVIQTQGVNLQFPSNTPPETLGVWLDTVDHLLPQKDPEKQYTPVQTKPEDVEYQ